MFLEDYYAELCNIRVSYTEGIRCEWRGEAEPWHDATDDFNQCTRNVVYRLDYVPVFYDFKVCTQHAKMVVKRQTGGEVMAESLKETAEMNKTIALNALQSFNSGWSAAMESVEEWDSV